MADTNYTRVTTVSSTPPTPYVFKMRPIHHKVGAK